MDNTTLAHIGGEIVVIAGIGIYFQKRVSSLQTSVDALTADNEIMAREILELKKYVMYLLDKIDGGNHHHKSKHREIPAQAPSTPPEPVSAIVSQPPPVPADPPKVTMTQVIQEEEEESANEELEAELTRIEQERGQCKDGVCSLD